MKGMKKIAVAQEEADHFRAPLEDPACLRIRAETEAPDGFKHSRASFSAYLTAGIQHPGNGPDAYGGSLGNVANRGFSWNYFHEHRLVNAEVSGPLG